MKQRYWKGAKRTNNRGDRTKRAMISAGNHDRADGVSRVAPMLKRGLIEGALLKLQRGRTRRGKFEEGEVARKERRVHRYGENFVHLERKGETFWQQVRRVNRRLGHDLKALR